ncbi:MAG TPA: hypothetical protein VLB02_01965 [Candidatus Paceibacterota bacterium]|nr:hypothetical protein [Candidatus Paceibacterota bacterium]
MLAVIIGADHALRKEKIDSLLLKEGIAASEVLVLDEAQATIGTLLSYADAPLFGAPPRALRARYFLEGVLPEDAALFTALHEARTLVLLEEKSLSAPLKKIIEKIGATLFTVEQKKAESKETVFSIANALATGDRKKLWLEYQRLLEKNAPEALFGILLWKVRQLATAGSAKEKYKTIYKILLEAQANSRRTRLPFELALERALLMLPK